VLYANKPFTGDAIAFICAVVILGIIAPLVVDSITNLEEIKVILIALEKIEEKVNHYDEMITNKSN